MLLRWTTAAVEDLTRICDYTEASFGPGRARRTAIAIYRAATTLGQSPNLGRKGRVPNTRELVIQDLPFVILYRLDPDSIEIVRILHGAQQWP